MFAPIATTSAPAAVGPYSQGMVTEQFVFTSGQIALHPETKTMPADIADQARQALANVRAVLEAAGSGLDKVVKVNIFLTDMDDFATVNAVYGTFFKTPYPARSCVAVAALPLGARIEIEAMAVKR